jgi:hypothetical protein
VEVNARLGGDLIPYLGLRATGIDPGLAAAAVACGRPPEFTAERRLVGAVRFFYVDHDDTTIEAVRFDDAGLPPAIDLTVPLAAPGDASCLHRRRARYGGGSRSPPRLRPRHRCAARHWTRPGPRSLSSRHRRPREPTRDPVRMPDAVQRYSL